MNISVVIPSLGGNLCATLESLNSGTIVPDEIIICLPNRRHSVSNLNKYTNTLVIYSNRYGQVFQRICGFKRSHGDQVLQLDDDVIVFPDCLELLINTINSTKKSISVSPCWYDSADRMPLHKRKQSGFLMSLYYWLVNGNRGYRSGEVSLAGTNFGINPHEIIEKNVNVDWQPGGCVLHDKNNLILEDYYPYKGKAYSEDLIHSYLLKQSGTILVANTDAICMTHINPRLQLRKELAPEYRARKYFVKLAHLSITRMFIYYVIYVIRSIFVLGLTPNI
jgi:glycosyltransferase involved in cell wall biosynthesis